MEEGIILNKEEKKNTVINFLLNTSGYTKATELADLLSISSKSIYRLINEINNSTTCKKIYSAKGKGFYINPDFNSLEITQNLISKSVKLSMSPIERRNEIIKDLLMSSPKPINVNQIVNKFYISESMLSVDEKVIIETIQQFNLKLIRKDRTLVISGDESNIRSALMQSMDTLYLNVEKLSSIPKSMEEKDKNFVYNQIITIEKTLNVNIPYPYNINIFSHLYILILRFRKHGKHDVRNHRSIETDENTMDSRYYRICDIIIKNFETYLSSKLPRIEKDYLYKYLTSYRIEHDKPSNNEKECDFSDDIINFANNLITPLEKRLHSNFSNTIFRIDLMKHIKPMINRLENNILIKNNLLEQIKFEYSEIYSQTSHISKKLIPTISEDEIGFLTLYFAREIERNPRKIKTLIACTTGIGTSELLRVKIEKNIPEIEVTDVISSDTINSEIINDIDLIISTISIKDFNLRPVVVVSAMFNKNDQAKLKSIIPKLGVNYE